MENKKPSNPLAFPSTWDSSHNATVLTENGMDLRDYFANSAMQALTLASATKSSNIWSKILIFFGMSGWTTNTNANGTEIAKGAYRVADEMLKQREL